MKSEPKKTNGEQPIGIFACQPVFLTLGKKGGFKAMDDFYRFASGECGFEAVSVPICMPQFDLDMATIDKDYVPRLDEHLKRLGLKEGLCRLEFHTFGQNVCLAPSRVLRFGYFIDDRFRSMSVEQIEKKATDRMRQIIDIAAVNPKLRRLVGFYGGKGYAVAQAKWSAWPKHLALWVIASLVAKWNPLLEYAADRNVTIHHELGHPENDLLTGANFVLFHRLLTEKARKGLGLQVDGSHFVNVGVDPIPHFEVAAHATGCPIANHYKWGGISDKRDGTCSTYGGWQNWSHASHTFYTIGTVGSEQMVRDFHAFNARHHKTQEGGVPIFYEGECVGLPNPRQAMKIGGMNCRNLRDGEPLIRLEGFVPEHQPIITSGGDRPKRICLPGRIDIEFDEWEGGAFDAFADSPVKPWELLGLDIVEKHTVMAILEFAGYADAAAAV